MHLQHKCITRAAGFMLKVTHCQEIS